MRYVVIGASAAGVNGARVLRKNDKGAEVTIIAPDEMIYSRCILHRFIDGARTKEGLSFVPGGFIEKNNINWIKARASGVDPAAKTVRLEDGGTVGYDKLLIAAGAVTKFPPITNLDRARNAFGLRTLEDAAAIKEHAAKARNIAVIGSGLIGCDAITGVLHSGASVACYELGAHMLPLNLDEYAAKTYERAFAERGVRQYYGVAVTEVVLDNGGMITALRLKDGREFACDMLIAASGVRANIGFLANSGLETHPGGLVYDARGRTSDENIYAAGDISGKSPIWPAAVKEGIIAANNMCGIASEMTDFFASKSTMNFLGIPTMAVGVPERPDASFAELADIDSHGNYKKVIHKDGEIKGAVLQGDLSYAGILTQLIRERIDVSRVKKPLFSIDYSDFFGEFEF